MRESLTDQAYRYCQWVTCRHDENFPVASWLLPAEARPYIAAIYAFARSADDFADEAKYQGRSLELLNAWRQALRACADGSADHPIFLALAHTIQRCHLPVQLLEDLLIAFTMDVTKKRYADWEELLTYCRYSANPVGRLVLAVFGIEDPKLLEYSDRICTALQMTNHWQDLRIDLARGILYIPKTLLDPYGITEDELKELAITGGPDSRFRGNDSQFQALMEDLVRRARGLFDEGEPLIGQVSGRLRLELKLTLLGGRAILDRIEAAHYDVFRRRPSLSRWAKAGLLVRALLR